MNERIKELIEQAGLSTLLGNNWLYGEQLEEFAELVRQDEREANAKLIEALRQALAQTEQPMSPEHLPQYIATNNIKPTTEGGGGGGSQPEQEKESTAQTVDPCLLLGRSNNFTKETENRLCDIERRLAAIETQPALAQPDNTSYSATRSADSAESFCKQELHNLMSVAGRMALEIECLLLDTKDLSVVSQWWDTGMESLQAYRDYIWSITHGKDGEHFCDTHCVHTDHHPDCELAQPEQEPVAWMYVNEDDECEQIEYGKPFDDPYVTPLYIATPSKHWVGLTEEEVDAIRKEIFEKYKKALLVTRDVTSENDYSAFNFYRAIEEKLRIKND